MTDFQNYMIINFSIVNFETKMIYGMQNAKEQNGLNT